MSWESTLRQCDSEDDTTYVGVSPADLPRCRTRSLHRRSLFHVSGRISSLGWSLIIDKGSPMGAIGRNAGQRETPQNGKSTGCGHASRRLWNIGNALRDIYRPGNESAAVKNGVYLATRDLYGLFTPGLGHRRARPYNSLIPLTPSLNKAITILTGWLIYHKTGVERLFYFRVSSIDTGIAAERCQRMLNKVSSFYNIIIGIVLTRRSCSVTFTGDKISRKVAELFSFVEREKCCIFSTHVRMIFRWWPRCPRRDPSLAGGAPGTLGPKINGKKGTNMRPTLSGSDDLIGQLGYYEEGFFNLAAGSTYMSPGRSPLKKIPLYQDLPEYTAATK
uniref:Uncharacterized protein n=1 Tax=Branchiostoma floridae TaxID=7739 RepID=C3Z4X6_BRAFL|eukprot:XP_002596321.1 hypothetical protein BRAFLDRAFT_76122 [Branchiostoma floridae]